MKAVHNEYMFINQINDGFLRIDKNGKIWRIAKKWRGKRYPVTFEREITCKNKHGYIQLYLFKDGKQYNCFASRVVWIFFKGSIPEGLQINHKNGIKADNRIENLEIVTQSENMKHAYRTGLRVMPKGEKNGNSKLTDNDVKEIRLRLQSGEKQRSIAQDFNINQQYVSLISNKKQWSHI